MNQENRRNIHKPAPIIINNKDKNDVVQKNATTRTHFTLHTQPDGQNARLTADDLWSMWKVATKAKSSIDQGPRLENLSWRLWYTTMGASQHSSSDLSTFDLQMAKTYLSILHEIQQMSLAHAAFASTAASSRSRLGAIQERFKVDPMNDHANSEFLFTSTSEAATAKDAHYLVRKKKKNIERFMKKNGQKRIGSVGEDDDDHHINTLTFDIENQQNSSESLQSNSVQSEPIMVQNNFDALFSKKPIEQADSLCSCFFAQKKPSLLSILLHKQQADASLKPSTCSFQYPNRPGAPAPPTFDHHALIRVDGVEENEKRLPTDRSS